MKIHGPKTALKKVTLVGQWSNKHFFLKNKYNELASNLIESRNYGRLPKSSNLDKYNLVVVHQVNLHIIFYSLNPGHRIYSNHVRRK